MKVEVSGRALLCMCEALRSISPLKRRWKKGGGKKNERGGGERRRKGGREGRREKKENHSGCTL
jgi:hypothetical protein